MTGVLLGVLVAARVLRGVDPDLATRWQWASSTTLHQMLHHPIGVLVGSIPWVAEGPVAPWLAFAALAVGGLEATVGSVAALAVAFGGHTAATLISEGILGLRVATGGLPSSALHVLDVGPSYAVGGALAALVALPARRRLRTVAGVTLVVVGPAMMYGVTDGELDGIGHTAALALGGLAGTIPALRRRAAHPAPSLSARPVATARPIQATHPASSARALTRLWRASRPRLACAPAERTAMPARWVMRVCRGMPRASAGTADVAAQQPRQVWFLPRGLRH
ncbi:rhomboid-like protein [Frankia sp. QA3]|uniref:rhomboid-like protein n=1 Tax=Frankia sp. QA3 TaxID=710111 RepID=UPI00031DC4E8|nr:rhomboid-like protein [Frankia sp. QA3]